MRSYVLQQGKQTSESTPMVLALVWLVVLVLRSAGVRNEAIGAIQSKGVRSHACRVCRNCWHRVLGYWVELLATGGHHDCGCTREWNCGHG